MYAGRSSQVQFIIPNIINYRIEQPYMVFDERFFQSCLTCQNLQRLCLVSKHSRLVPKTIETYVQQVLILPKSFPAIYNNIDLLSYLLMYFRSLFCKQYGPRSGPEVIKLFSCSTQLRMKFQLLIKTKMLKN